MNQSTENYKSAGGNRRNFVSKLWSKFTAAREQPEPTVQNHTSSSSTPDASKQRNTASTPISSQEGTPKSSNKNTNPSKQLSKANESKILPRLGIKPEVLDSVRIPDSIILDVAMDIFFTNILTSSSVYCFDFHFLQLLSSDGIESWGEGSAPTSLKNKKCCLDEIAAFEKWANSAKHNHPELENWPNKWKTIRSDYSPLPGWGTVDCGIHVMLNAFYFIRGYTRPTYDIRHINQFRKILTDCIVNERIHPLFNYLKRNQFIM